MLLLCAAFAREFLCTVRIYFAARDNEILACAAGLGPGSKPGSLTVPSGGRQSTFNCNKVMMTCLLHGACSECVHAGQALAQGNRLGTLKVPDLKEYLEAHSLPKSGNKTALIERIQNHLSSLNPT